MALSRGATGLSHMTLCCELILGVSVKSVLGNQLYLYLKRNLTFPIEPQKGFLTALMQLKKFPDIPVSAQEEHRGSCHKQRRALFFPPHLEMTFHFPASSGKEFQHSCRTSSGGGLNLKLERNSRGLCSNSKRPQCPNPLQIKLISLHGLDCHPKY